VKRLLGSLNLRKWSTVGMGVAMLVLGVVAIAQAQVLQAELEARELVRVEQDLRQLADGLESLVADQVSGWFLDLAETPNPALHETAHRKHSPWFDAFYLWEIDANTPRFLYPPQVTKELTDLLEPNPCVQRARILSQEAVEQDLRQLYASCASQAPEIRLLAAWRGAQTLLLLDRPHDTLQALERLRSIENYSIAKAVELDLDPERVVRIRLQRIDALTALEMEQDALKALLALYAEIVTLAGPVQVALGTMLLDELGPRFATLAPDRNPKELENAARLVRRRAEGWSEIRDKAALRQAPRLEEGPRGAYDLYASRPFLLAIAQVDDGRAAAIQLDQQAILEEVVRRAGELRQYLVILDARNEVLYGAVEPGLAAEASFGGLLGHLRVGISQNFISEQAGTYKRQFAWQALTVVLATLIGSLALLARVAADRRETDLLVRQKEFTARVTHELKTPLAGIRVMAENLEMGFGDEETKLAFARRIISEADRLTGRIDAVLRLSHSNEPQQSGPIDLRGLLEKLVKTWRPQMEESGITLYGSLQPVGVFIGDEPMIRDTLNGLLDNALKYHRTDHPDPRVWVRLRHTGKHAIIDVEDNGLGVPTHKRKVIFQRFARIEGPQRGKSGGHGLGLAYAADTVRAHGGRIECVAGSEGGARFVIHLPLERRRS
jgi:signal transduction histidine kinase